MQCLPCRKRNCTTGRTAIRNGVIPLDYKVLIAITSCHKHRPWQQSQRDTWLKDVEGMDYRFFLGRPIADAAPDEVFLDVADGYNDLLYKTQGLLRWALERDYDYLYKTDVDTLVIPSRLIHSGFEQHDYTGSINHAGKPYGILDFASGGSGYWLSRKVMEWVVNAKSYTGSAEDVFVAEVCRENGVLLHSDLRYKYHPGLTFDKDTISFHISSTNGWPGDAGTLTYTPEQMYTVYERSK